MTAQELIPAAMDDFSAKVRAVPDDRWQAPTPCTEWTVRDLVNHLTYEHLWAPHLLHGETLEQVGDRYDGDVLGDDPVGSWTAAAEASRAVWPQTDPDSSVHLSSGLNPLSEYAEQMYLDLVVHGWDLARGAGLDDTIDPVAAEHMLAYITPRVRDWAGVFAPPVPTTSDNPSDRLLALVGRSPTWPS
jgi:uncharacterized protein (TIGR03086 family)